MGSLLRAIYGVSTMTHPGILQTQARPSTEARTSASESWSRPASFTEALSRRAKRSHNEVRTMGSDVFLGRASMSMGAGLLFIESRGVQQPLIQNRIQPSNRLSRDI